MAKNKKRPKPPPRQTQAIEPTVALASVPNAPQSLIVPAQGSPTSIEAWRSGTIGLYQLPSGRTARLKRIGLLDLVTQGDIPDTLSPLVADLTNGKANPNKISVDELSAYSELVNLACVACFVEPPLAKEASGTHLGVYEVDYVDRVNVFLWANDGARKLEPFRQK